jgi:hypothetical protein
VGLLILLLILIFLFGSGGFYSTRSGWGGEALPSVLYLLCVIVVVVLVLNLLGVY